MKNLFCSLIAIVISVFQFIFPFTKELPVGIAEIENIDGVYTFYYPNSVKDVSLFKRLELLSRDENATSFEGENNSREGTSIIVSPYFKAEINGNKIPVYSTLTYSGTKSEVVFHSYATIFVDTDNFDLQLKLDPDRFIVKKSQVFPTSLGAKAEIKLNKVYTQLNKFGSYTFLFNDDDQKHGLTVFVKPYVDENKEIENYKLIYGENNVTVFEPGIHNIDFLNINQSNSVIYLKAGALILPNHNFEITKQEDDWEIIELDAPQNNSAGLARYPVINCYDKENICILGNGTIDMTQLDWHERRGVVFSSCNNITLKNIFIVNPAEWAIITCQCKNIEIDSVNIFGYRTNSDAFAICNSENATINNCFARSGDDLFEVKTLNTATEKITKNVTFSNCVAWNGKARCFGITHEVFYSISDVTFKDSCVVFRDATWNNDFVSSLAIDIGQGGADVTDITFENIEINKDTGRPLNILACNDGIINNSIDNIVFKNITWNSNLKANINIQSTNKLNTSFENIVANGEIISLENTDNWLESNGGSYTIK